jgi:hypothetical protein
MQKIRMQEPKEEKKEKVIKDGCYYFRKFRQDVYCSTDHLTVPSAIIEDIENNQECKIILFDKLNVTVNELQSLNDITTILEDVGGGGVNNSNIRKILDITNLLETSDVDSAQFRFEIENSIKTYYFFDVTKKTKYFLKSMLARLEVTTKSKILIDHILKNKYNYVVCLNQANVCIINKKQNKKTIRKYFKTYLEDIIDNSILDTQGIINQIHKVCNRHQVNFVDSTDDVNKDRGATSLNPIFDSVNTINIVRITSRIEWLFTTVANRISNNNTFTHNLNDSVMVFNGCTKTILIPKYTKEKWNEILEEHLFIRQREQNLEDMLQKEEDEREEERLEELERENESVEKQEERAAKLADEIGPMFRKMIQDTAARNANKEEEKKIIIEPVEIIDASESEEEIVIQKKHKKLREVVREEVAEEAVVQKKPRKTKEVIREVVQEEVVQEAVVQKKPRKTKEVIQEVVQEAVVQKKPRKTKEVIQEGVQEEIVQEAVVQKKPRKTREVIQEDVVQEAVLQKKPRKTKEVIQEAVIEEAVVQEKSRKNTKEVKEFKEVKENKITKPKKIINMSQQFAIEVDELNSEVLNRLKKPEKIKEKIKEKKTKQVSSCN